MFSFSLSRPLDLTQQQVYLQALSVLFQAMTSGKHRVITAGRFRVSSNVLSFQVAIKLRLLVSSQDIISSASRFDNADQQDAHDFL